MKLDFPLGCLEGSTVFACPAVLEEVPLPCLAALEELWMTDPAPLVMGMDSPSGHGPSWYLISLATVTGPWRGHMPESGPVRTLHGMSIHGECMRKVLVFFFFFFFLLEVLSWEYINPELSVVIFLPRGENGL